MFSSKDLFFTPAAGGYTVSKSLRFRSSASAYLYRTFGSPTNQIKWTYSFWYKRGKLGTAMDFICSPAASGDKYFDFLINASDQLVFQYGTSGTSATNMTTTPVLRDPSAWYHVVLSVDLTLATSANRVRIYLNNVEITAGTPPGQNDTTYLFNTAVQHTIMSEWNGSSTYGGFHDGYITQVNFIDGQQLTPSSFGAYDTNGVWQPTAYSGSGYGNNGFFLKFTDTTSTTTLCSDSNATTTTVSSAAYFSPTGGVSQSGMTFRAGTSVSNFYNGLTTDIICFNNPVNTFLALDAGSGNTLNLTKWGFYLRNASSNETWSIQYSSDNSSWSNAATGFSPSAAGWNDVTFSSVGSYRYWRAIVTTQVNGEYYTEYRVYGTGSYTTANNWTPANISLTSGVTYDSMLDSPTNATGDIGNYCTLNPLVNAGSTISNANLTITASTGYDVTGTQSPNYKCYFEMTIASSAANSSRIGMGDVSVYNPWVNNFNSANGAFGVIAQTGKVYVNGTNTATYSTATAANDVVGFAFDPATGKFWYSVNGVWANSGDPDAGTGNAGTGTVGLNYVPVFAFFSSTSGSVNFGQRPFTYAPSSTNKNSTFYAINTQNLTTPTITNGAQYMAAVTYTGNGTASTSITASSTNSGNNPNSTTFQPDLVWIKSRSAATNNNLFDSVRTATNYLISNTTAANATNANTLTAFNSNGFTLGTDAGSVGVNINTNTYVAWEWLASGSSGTISPAGTISATGRVNQTAGFSIVTFTGTGTASQSVGHGLGAIPQFIVNKRTNAAGNYWIVYSAALGATKELNFNTTVASTTSGSWGNTTPTANVFYVGSGTDSNGSGDTYITYCWTPISGFSSFGSYTGNGSTDGVFVYTGFRSRWIMFKRTDTTSVWTVMDTSRDTYNVASNRLYPNLANAEDTDTVVDCLSNGFKIRTTGTYVNASGGSYIYAAFAENPFKISRAR